MDSDARSPVLTSPPPASTHDDGQSRSNSSNWVFINDTGPNDTKSKAKRKLVRAQAARGPHSHNLSTTGSAGNVDQVKANVTETKHQALKRKKERNSNTTFPLSLAGLEELTTCNDTAGLGSLTDTSLHTTSASKGSTLSSGKQSQKSSESPVVVQVEDKGLYPAEQKPVPSTTTIVIRSESPRSQSSAVATTETVTTTTTTTTTTKTIIAVPASLPLPASSVAALSKTSKSRSPDSDIENKQQAVSSKETDALTSDDQGVDHVEEVDRNDWNNASVVQRMPGTGWAHPFISHPDPEQPYFPMLINHYLSNLAVDVPELDAGVPFILRLKWFPMVITSPATLYVVLLTAASHYAASHPSNSPTYSFSLSTPRVQRTLLNLKDRCLSAINKSIRETPSGFPISDTIIGAVAKMASYEAMFGTPQLYHTHMRGLQSMIQARGGLHKLGLDGLLMRMVLWIDINSAFLLGGQAYFLPTVPLAGHIATGIGAGQFADGVTLGNMDMFLQPNPAHFLGASKEI